MALKGGVVTQLDKLAFHRIDLTQCLRQVAATRAHQEPHPPSPGDCHHGFPSPSKPLGQVVKVPGRVDERIRRPPLRARFAKCLGRSSRVASALTAEGYFGGRSSRNTVLRSPVEKETSVRRASVPVLVIWC